ncbi:NAD(P)H-dependent oxidoreductase [Cellulosilyticum ruminicola]|uniref:NAD(P)H-dependent oxidoreductase n=1 Tax=Cellulosilyticum ruminicola TaxID=425254 RepID=UPI0006CF4765|nr:NAD(P)H-dependent oxidoreductase [Cellulosilyticum ruminicola]
MSRSLFFINGSPRPAEKSCSHKMIQYFTEKLTATYTSITCANIDKLYHTHCFEDHFKQAVQADTLVIMSPLYIDDLPSCVLDYLEQFECYIKSHPHEITHPIRLYAFINCGFMGGYQNTIALDVLKHFSNHIGFIWSGGLGVGSGSLLASSTPLEHPMHGPIIKGAELLISAIKEQSPIPTPDKKLLITPDLPFPAFMDSIHKLWYDSSDLTEDQFYHKPYAED